MHDYQEVFNAIIQHIIIRLLPMTICSIALIAVFVVAIKQKILAKKALWIVAVWCIIVISYILYKFMPLYFDIESNSYITYNGKFEYIEDFNKNCDRVILANGLTLNCEGIDMSSGNYNGKLIYCDNAKWVLEININKKILS